jgi:C-terminal processing protease CtpA/Prc
VEFGGPVPDLIRGKGTRGAGEAAAEPTINDLLEPWQRPLEGLMTALSPDAERAVLGVGVQTPWYVLPAGFELRLGRSTSDAFYTGRYTHEGLRIGLIRIPSYTPPGTLSQALSNFEREIAWMQENTDGLILDTTRNPGGLVNYVEELCRRVIPEPFRAIGFEVRATIPYVSQFQQTYDLARALGLPEWTVQGYQERLNAVKEAYKQSRGKTPPVSLTNPWLDLEPVRNVSGQVTAYSKPVMVLVDEFSSSAADAFAATLQDAKRGPLFGYRTNGMGGSVTDAAGILPYSEFGTRVTLTQMVRKANVKSPGLPEAPYVENIGVQPEIEYDAMTRENLTAQWRPYVEAFTRAMADHIKSSQ